MTPYNLIDVAIYDFGFDKLPPELPFIVLSDDLELDKLAKMTDGILSRIAINDTVMSASVIRPRSNSSSELTARYTKVDYLVKAMNHIHSQIRTTASAHNRGCVTAKDFLNRQPIKFMSSTATFGTDFIEGFNLLLYLTK